MGTYTESSIDLPATHRPNRPTGAVRHLAYNYCTTQLNSAGKHGRTQVSGTSISVSVLSNQIYCKNIKTILLHNFLRSVSDTSQIGGKIKLNYLVRPKLIYRALNALTVLLL